MGLVVLEERAEYDAAVRGAEVSVVSFLAGWSKPCKALKRELEAASEQEQHAAVKFFEVDLETEEGEALALELGVDDPPTVVVFRAGTKLAEFASAKVTSAAVLGTIAGLGAMSTAALDEAAAEKQRELIRRAYGATASGRGIVGLIEGNASGGCCDTGSVSGACCGDTAPAPSTLQEPQPLDFAAMSEKMGYSSDQVKALGNLGLGCGNPFTDANIVEGETVLDLGSGARARVCVRVCACACVCVAQVSLSFPHTKLRSPRGEQARGSTASWRLRWSARRGERSEST